MKNAFKVAVLGSPRVGKTTIIDEAIYGNHYRLKNPYEPTSEDIYCAMVEYDKNSREKIFLYDYGGMVFKCFMIFEIDFFFVDLTLIGNIKYRCNQNVPFILRCKL